MAAKDKERYEMALSEYVSWQDAHGMDEYKSYISRRKQFLQQIALKREKLLVSACGVNLHYCLYVSCTLCTTFICRGFMAIEQYKNQTYSFYMKIA